MSPSGRFKAAAASTLLAAAPKKNTRRRAEKLGTARKSQLEPLWGLKHNPSADVVMALGLALITKLRGFYFRRRDKGDIVLAAGPPEIWGQYLRGEGASLPVSYECVKAKKGELLMTPAGCILTNWYRMAIKDHHDR